MGEKKPKSGGTSLPPPSQDGVRTSQKGVVLLDLNATLITDDDAVITCTPAELREAVIRAGRAGWWVGLCSDSPYVPLLEWGCRHGIHAGGVIGENGAVINGVVAQTDFDCGAVEASARWWAERYSVAILNRRALAREFGGYKPEGPGIAFGEGRVCSVSLFCYNAAEEPNPAVTQLLGNYIASLYGCEQVDLDVAAGFIAVHSSDYRSMKGQTLRRIGAELAAQGRHLVLIGNSVSDLIGDPALGESWMVANATHEAKEQADRVLTLPHTQGVIEGLKLLSRR